MNKLVIEDPAPSLMRSLKRLAEHDRLSISELAKRMLDGAVDVRRFERAEIAASVAALTPAVPQTDAATLIRDDRDR